LRPPIHASSDLCGARFAALSINHWTTGAIIMTERKPKAKKAAKPPVRTFEVTIAETRYSIITVEALTARAAKLEAAEIFHFGDPDSSFTAPYKMSITAQ
jgi:hypothetical protein